MSYFDDNEDSIVYGRRRARDRRQIAWQPMCRTCGILVFFNNETTDMFSDPMCTVKHTHHAQPSADDFEALE